MGRVSGVLNSAARGRQQATYLALGVSLALLAYLLARSGGHMALPVDDFVEYWAAGRLNVTRGDPYAASQLLALQRTVGWPEAEALRMWNPPWALALVMPFGLAGYPAARLAWLIANTAAVILCAHWLWRYYGLPERRGLAWLLPFSFAPTLIALRLGQIGPLILLGVTGFLYFERRAAAAIEERVRRRNLILAGACTVLVALKPQLLYLFWIAFLLWALRGQRRAALTGALLAGALATGIACVANPAVLGQYLASAAENPPLEWATPTLGFALRLLAGPQQAWLQFAPAALGVAGLLWYWRGRRDGWRWRDAMPVLLVASLVTTPYGWVFDQTVLWPAVIQVAAWLYAAEAGRPAGQAVWWVAGYAAWNALLLAFSLLGIGLHWYLWAAPSFAIAYFVAMRGLATPETGSRPAGAAARGQA